MFRLTRRTFLWSANLLLLSRPVLGHPALAGLSSTAPVTLDDFVDLSQRLVGRTKLDRDVAKIYLDALNASKDLPTLQYLVEINNNPTPEMKALAATIIGWWYTGVYEVAGQPRLATHTGALMWDAMGMPAPGTCAGPFGAWSRPPAAI